MREADVVVVGLGAVGGLAAARLALAGADVVGLEAGRGYGVEEFAPDQLRTDVRGWLMSGQGESGVPDRARSRPTRSHAGRASQA